MREKVQKGADLNISELKQLERSEWLNNFIGALAKTLQMPDAQLAASNYKGLVFRPAFYHIVGARLFAIGKHTNNDDYLLLAKRYFKAILELTKQQPYQSDRQRAEDFLAKLAEYPLDSKKSSTTKK